MILETLVAGEYQTNCYIVGRETSRDALIIDPGDDVGAIKGAIAALGVVPRAIALTHGHFDHLLGAAALKEAYGAPVYISRADEPALRDQTINALPEHTFAPFTPLTADGYLDEGPVTLAGMDFTVLATPGHTIGGVCLWAEEEGLLFTGDTLFARGFGRTDLYGGNWGQLLHSLRRLFALPGDPLVCPGHGDRAHLIAIRKGYYR